MDLGGNNEQSARGEGAVGARGEPPWRGVVHHSRQQAGGEGGDGGRARAKGARGAGGSERTGRAGGVGGRGRLERAGGEGEGRGGEIGESCKSGGSGERG